MKMPPLSDPPPTLSADHPPTLSPSKRTALYDTPGVQSSWSPDSYLGAGQSAAPAISNAAATISRRDGRLVCGPNELVAAVMVAIVLTVRTVSVVHADCGG